MGRVWTAILVAVLGLVVGGCLPKEEGGCPTCPGSGAAGVLLPVETVEQGAYSGVRDERAVVVRDGSAWALLWAEHVAGRVPPPALPAVDFSREMVVAYFLGDRPTSGCSAEIREVVLAQGRLFVRVAVGSPPPGAPVLQVLTQPFHIVKFPRYDFPVEFEVVEVPGEGAQAGR